MSKPTATPRWGTSLANPSDIVEPLSGKKDIGWQDSEMPPHSYMNWLFNLIYQWCVYLDGLTGEALTWTALETFSAGVVVAGGLTANALTVTGNATVGGTLGVTGALSLSGALHVGGNETVGGTLDVTGNLTAEADAAVLGTLFANDIEPTSVLNINGGLAVANGLAVTGNETVTGTLSAGATALSSLAVAGAETVGGTLGVTGLATFNGGITLNGSESISNALTVNGVLTAAGGITTSAPVAVAYGPSWADAGGSFEGLKVFKDAFGVKHLEGLPKNSTNDNDLVGTLPGGYHPAVAVFLVLRLPAVGGGFADQEITIGTDGSISADSYDHTAIDTLNFFNVTFR